LTGAEAAKRRNEFGPNMITPPKRKHWIVKFKETFFGGFQTMMIGGFILCLIVFGLSNGEDH